ncbi:MAG: rod shape-determining protein MreC [Lautropia sp.]|nr:rod shape-determining protein MreC [Lautropia sp.]
MNTRPPLSTSPNPSIALLLVLLALALMFADVHLEVMMPMRQTLGGLLYPVQVALGWPGRQLATLDGYFNDIAALREDNQTLKLALTQQAGLLATTERLRHENQALRKLAALRPQIPQPGIVAESLLQPRAPGTYRRLLDKGRQDGVSPGQPVIDALGVIGQITRVYPFSSEMTLITDPVMSVPVSIRRNGLHALVFGTATPARMELRFLTQDADVQTGDLLQTSGLDFLYPPGIPVGVVEDVRHPADEPFAQVIVRPLAALADPRLVLILQPDTSLIPDEDLTQTAPAGTAHTSATTDPARRRKPDAAPGATAAPTSGSTPTVMDDGPGSSDPSSDPTASGPAAPQP